MDDQTNVPQDMWPDEKPVRHQGVPTNQPPVAPVASPMQPQGGPLGVDSLMPKPKLPRKRAGWVNWVVTIIILAIIALGGGYAFGKYWPTIQSWFNKDTQQTDQTNSDGQVAWQNKEPIANLNLMLPQDDNTNSENANSLSRYYKVGTLVSGPYEGGDLILASLSIQTIGIGGGSGEFYRFIKKTDGSLVLLTKQSLDLLEDDGVDRSKFSKDNNYQIAGLYFPSTITNPNNAEGWQLPLVFKDNYIGVSSWFDDEVKYFRKVFTDDKWGDVYTDKTPTTITRDNNSDYTPRYGFYLRAPDGTGRTYTLNLSNIIPESGVPFIMWTGSSKPNDQEYAYTDHSGCGTANLASVMPNSLVETVETGRLSNESAVYELKDTNHQLLKDLFDMAKSNPAYAKLTYVQFLKEHPIFFTKDSFTRLIKFQIKKYIPMAECGKPVIYLYPEKTTRVSVKVNPVGGFSYTDPDYGTGWDVIAKSNGELTEVKSQKTYPYLFWEGRGGLYQAPNQGWVIKQAEVSSFLDDKLAQLGLNVKESADFKEFWLPRMQGAPYYFVGFWGNGVMNNIAPLNITPKPDTVVRILMDFKPLQQPIKVTAPTIKTPERRGFTVIEWGGVIQ